MSVMSPTEPVRADHRFIKKVISVNLQGKVAEIPSEFSRVSRVFSKSGGSWERLFRGSVDEVLRLRKVVKLAYKLGYLTKKGKW